MIVNILSALLLLAVAFIPDSPLRTMLGVPFVLFFPGYTLICALFPGAKDLDGIERIALSIGLSLAIVPLIALALNYTPWGIRLIPVIASLFTFILLMSAMSLYRRSKLPPEQKFTPTIPVKLPKWTAMPKADKIFLVGFLIGIVAVASFTGYLASSPKIGEQFTEFYLLGSNGKLADYPTNMTLGENGTVTIGITNHEYQNVTYKVIISLDNQTLETINGIQLSHQANWTQNYTFTPDKIGERMKLEFNLYKDASIEPYRNLQLWVTVKPPQ
ncbi:MAG: DUF1616 domain-containing protein [Candidatus Bathyarchaeota archaeon]|nr:DUF1616 domain-containing protein [Candidatus Bathyarchaeota archaeon]